LKILAIDTSTEVMSIAYRDEGKTYLFSRDGDLRHSETLMPTLLRIVGLARTDETGAIEADLVVCTRGPGSFTGLRIGMATAKGISAGANCPLVSVPTLDLFSWGHDAFDGAVVPAVDARKNRFYCAVFVGGKRLTEDMDAGPGTVLEKLEHHRRVLLTGPDAPALAAELRPSFSGERTLVVDPLCRAGYGSALLALGVREYEHHGAASEQLGPVYLRGSDADLSLGRPPSQ
jgi:tRNA threonylcarbamoyladenosine biosynthesis protein TsaB